MVQKDQQAIYFLHTANPLATGSSAG